MNYRNLGRTGLKVSELCLGTMQWGWTADEATGHQVMDAFVEAGGNFIDTADIYSRWAEGNPGGVSEQIIGRWMKERGNRDQIVLATKVRGRMWDGPNGEGLSRVHIIKACEDSLRRLQTDYIDLYQTHWYDAETPIEETMEALDTLVRQGKVRYVGCSNYPAWRLMQALWASDKHNLVRYDAHPAPLQPGAPRRIRARTEGCLPDLWPGRDPLQPAGRRLSDRQVPPQRCSRVGARRGVRKRYMNEQGFAVLDGHGHDRSRATARCAADRTGLAACPALHYPAHCRREFGAAIDRTAGRGRSEANGGRGGGVRHRGPLIAT